MKTLSPLSLSGHADVEAYDSTTWAAQQSVLVYGVRIGLRTNKPELLNRLSDHLPPLWKPSLASRMDRLFSLKRSKHQYELFENDKSTIKTTNLKPLLKGFERRLKIYVAEMARRRVFVHAGAVGWQGRAIIIPGQSMSGKTSLVKELVRAGATYYSDEYAVLDHQGRVHPYPQPLAIREGGSFVQTHYAVEKLGGHAGRTPLPVGLIVCSRYRSDVRWRPETITAGQAILYMLNHTIPTRRKPKIVFSVRPGPVGQLGLEDVSPS